MGQVHHARNAQGKEFIIFYLISLIETLESLSTKHDKNFYFMKIVMKFVRNKVSLLIQAPARDNIKLMCVCWCLSSHSIWVRYKQPINIIYWVSWLSIALELSLCLSLISENMFVRNWNKRSFLTRPS